MRIVPRSVAQNLNQLVTVAVSELVARFRQAEFEREMARMAADSAVRRESASIDRQFRPADPDGL